VGDWPDWRGPDRDGPRKKRDCPKKWSLKGENLAWKAPYGGRSTPIVLGDHLYMENTAGKGETEQERILCFNADTGKLLWEYKFNMFQSDVPAHRVGLGVAGGRPGNSNVYVFGGNNLLTALTKDGKKIWERSITEEFSPFTTHGGRTVSPVIDGNLVIVSTPTSDLGRAGQPRAALHCAGQEDRGIEWVSTPGGRPYDTSLCPDEHRERQWHRLLMTGGADGAALGDQAAKPASLCGIWWSPSVASIPESFSTASMRSVSHSEENLDSNEMGMLAAFDATAKGKLGKENISGPLRDFWAAFHLR